MFDSVYAIYVDGKLDIEGINRKSAECRFDRIVQDNAYKQGVVILNMRYDRVIQKQFKEAANV